MIPVSLDEKKRAARMRRPPPVQAASAIR